MIDVLTGKGNERAERLGHDKLGVFGVGKDIEPRVWQSVIRQLTAAGLIHADQEAHGALKLTEEARPVLRGEQKVTLRRDPPPKRTKKEARASKAADMPEGAQPLFQQLRTARARIAKSQGVPPYVVFYDTTLRAIAEARPKTLDANSGNTGIGKAKLDRYGAMFLEVIQANT